MKKIFTILFLVIFCCQWLFAESTEMTFNGTSTTANNVTFTFTLGAFTNSTNGTTLTTYDNHPYGTPMNGGGDYADIQISQSIYIESIYLAWAINVQSAVIQFYAGNVLTGEIRDFDGSIGIQNVNCYADKIRILDAGSTSNDGGVEISKVTFNTSGVWMGTANSSWGNASNWGEGSLPASTDDVIIPDNPVNNLVIESSTVVEINDLIVESGGSLTLESDASNTASLIVNGSFSGK